MTSVWFMSLIRVLFFSLDKIIYSFAGTLYNFLIDLARVRIFSPDNELPLVEITKNLYTLIGIVMLFKIAITLITIMSNPEKAFIEKEGGTAQYLIPRLTFTILLLMFTPFIFEKAYQLQDIVLRNQVIPRLLNIVTGDLVGEEDIFMIRNEQCVMNFDQAHVNFIHKCQPAHIANPGSPAEGCVIDGAPLIGIGSSIVPQNPENILDEGNRDYRVNIFDADSGDARELGSEFVINLNYSTSQIYFFDYSVDDYNNIKRYFTTNFLQGGSVHEGSIAYGDDQGKLCKNYAVIELIEPATHPYSYMLTFFSERPDVPDGAKNKVVLKRDPAKSLLLDYELVIGKQFSSKILFAFIRPSGIASDATIKEYMGADETGNFNRLTGLITKKVGDEFELDYNFLISTAFGVVIVLFLITSCFDIAKRVITLAFLQVIAPIPIASYIQYGGGTQSKNATLFDKYLSLTLSTYADIFVRVLSISFATFMIGIAINYDTAQLVEQVSTPSDIYITYIRLFLVLGALMFMKAVPGYLANMFGSMTGGGFELNPLKKLSEVPLVGGPASSAIGRMATGTVGGGVGAIAAGVAASKAKMEVGDIMSAMGTGLQQGARAGWNATTPLGPLLGGRAGGVGAVSDMYYGQMDPQLQKANNDLSSVNSRLASLTSEEAGLDKTITDLDTEKGTLQHRLLTAPASMPASEISRMQARVAEIDTQKSVTQAKKTAVQADITKAKGEKSVAETKVKDIKDQMAPQERRLPRRAKKE